jgi:hypothetical protein
MPTNPLGFSIPDYAEHPAMSGSPWPRQRRLS